MIVPENRAPRAKAHREILHETIQTRTRGDHRRRVLRGDDRGEPGAAELADGSVVEAEHVVLATGNEPPAGLPGSAELEGHPGWIGNPWQAWENRLPAAGGTVVLLGTGLTSVDAIITMRTLGWMGIVHA